MTLPVLLIALPGSLRPAQAQQPPTLPQQSLNCPIGHLTPCRIDHTTGAISTTANDDHGIFVEAVAGTAFDVTATLSGGMVSTDGRNAYGVYAEGNGSGNVTVTMSGGTVSTTGDFALGLYAFSTGTGAATTNMSAGMVSTADSDASGLYAASSGTGAATTNMSGGAVSTANDGAHGLYAISGGAGAVTVTLSGGRVSTEGSIAYGLNAQSTATGTGAVTANMSDGMVSTEGNSAHGLIAFSSGTANVAITMTDGTVTTTGVDADGLRAVSTGGSYAVNITAGTVTSGSGTAAGIHLEAAAGGSLHIGANATIDATAIIDAAASISGSGIAIRDNDIDTNGDGTLDTGGNATLTVAGTVRGDILLGLGTDSLTLSGNGQITGNIDLGAGNDTVTLNDTARITGNINTGAGDDTVTLASGGSIEGDLDLGAGDDTLTFEAGFVGFNGLADGGAGMDTLNGLDLFPSAMASTVFSYTNFETVIGEAQLLASLPVIRMPATGNSIGRVISYQAAVPAVPPPVVQPPAVQPPVVQPPAVQPPAVQPPAVQPPAVQPPAVQPPAVQPPAGQPPAVQPPAVQPSVTAPDTGTAPSTGTAPDTSTSGSTATTPQPVQPPPPPPPATATTDAETARLSAIYGNGVVAGAALQTAAATLDNTTATQAQREQATEVVEQYLFVDPTGPSLQAASVGALTSGINNLIQRRLSIPNSPSRPSSRRASWQPVQVAANALLPGMLAASDTPLVWGEFFGANRRRGQDGFALAHKQEYRGVLFGFEQDYGQQQQQRQQRLGVMLGYANAEVATHTAALEVKTNSLIGGLYGRFSWQALDVDAGLNLGYEFHDNSRFIPQTNHTAVADYNSLFLNPSLTISRRFDRQTGMVLRPLASISYTVARYGRYSERQAEGFNLDINARSARNLLTRLQLGGSWQSAKTSELGLRLGLEGRFTGGSKFKGSLLNEQRLPVPGASFNNASRTDNSVANIYIGIDGRHRLDNGLSLVLDMEYSHDLGKVSERAVSGTVRLEYAF